MARQQGACNPNSLKALVVVLGLCLVAYILGPPLYWHLAEGLVALSHSSCPSCVCDCALEPLMPTGGLNSTSFTGCEKRDPGVNEEMEKNFSDLLTEELKLQEAVSLENQQKADIALLEAKKFASQYQKEADKCNSGMETCEEAREKAQDALAAQKKLAEMWEQRARRQGWEDGGKSEM